MTTPDTSAHPRQRLATYLRRHRGRLAWATAHTVLNKVFDLAPPLLIGLAVDVVANGGSPRVSWTGAQSQEAQLVALGALTFIVWAGESFFEWRYQLAWRSLAQDVQHDLRLAAYEHFQDLDHEEVDRRRTGDLLAVMNDDVNQLERFLDVGLMDLIKLATTIVVVGAIFFAESPLLALWACVPVPFIVWGSIRFQTRLEPHYAEVRDQAGMVSSALTNNVLGLTTIKSFTAEGVEAERIAAASHGYRQANLGAIRLSSRFVPLIRMAILVGFLGTLVFGGLLAIDGAITVGSYSVLTYLTQRLLWPLVDLGQTLDQYQRAMASTQRIFDLIDTPSAITSGPATLSVTRGEGAITFEGVRFAYPDGELALDGIDLEIPADATTAVVGPTGSGKSTLVKLALRFHDPSDGRVAIDGTAVGDLQLPDLRSAIGLVSQDVYLFHGTVAENIAYGRPGSSAHEIEAAAHAAEAMEFIERLPLGMDTIVGEQGHRLSGGQRQRISIARAVLKDPPILILDEATSAVDNETEAAIQRSLDRLTVSRTTLVIAHRLSTVRNADRIHVLDRGRITESGTHDELAAAGGTYSTLWRVQTGEATGPNRGRAT